MAIVIVDHDPAWSAGFEAEAARIRAALGDVLVAVEHVGSTAVPGLAAKPVVDIMPGVATAADLDRCVAPLAALGYEFRPHATSIPDRRFFRRRGGGIDLNVHVNVVGNDDWRRLILFRDWLRAHPDDARRYAELKRELALRFDDVLAYADAKSDFVSSILAKAVG